MPRVTLHALLAMLLFPAAIVVLTACGSTAKVPDLGDLYNEVARYHDQQRNPIVVIPGLLGSKLVDPATGQVVWGAFGGGATNPQKPDGARLFALPMAEGRAIPELLDDVETDGVLEKISVKLAGLPIQLQAYFQILLTLGAGGYRDQTLNYGTLQVDYGSEHFTCFQFDYDWRLDNVTNARRLARFLEEKAEFVRAQRMERWGSAGPPVRFDIIAHSMGGLVLRYFLRYGDADLPIGDDLPTPTWAGAWRVERAILIGVPNGGSVEAIEQLVNGRKFGPFTPRYEPAVLGTLPGAYQLLPRARFNSLVDTDGRTALDPLDPEVWIEHGWGLADPRQDDVLAMLLPEAHDAVERRRIALDHLRKSLDRAERFHQALDVSSEPPRGTELYLIAGDAMDTPNRVGPRDGKMEILDTAPGDGTVLRSSALMDERVDGHWSPELRSPIQWRHVTFLFNSHLGLTQDPAFADNVLYLLLEAPRSPVPMSGP